MKSLRLPVALIGFIGATSLAQSQALLPTDVSVLTQHDFAAHHYFSVGDALRGVTSLKLEQDGSRGTRILAKMRGLSSSNNVQILLDGRPLTHEYDSEVDLSQIPLGMVDRIEITRGGSSLALGSQAVGGAINIITVRPEQKGLVADMGTGVGRSGEKNLIGKIRGRSNLGDLTYAPSLESSGGFQDNEDFQTTNHFGNFTRSFNGKGYWGGEYYFHQSRVGLSNGTPIPFSQWNGHLERKSSTPYEQHTEESQHAKVFLALPLFKDTTSYATYTDSHRKNKKRLTRGGTAVRDEDSHASTFDLSIKKRTLDMGLRSERFTRKIFPEDARYVYQNGFYATGKWTSHRLTLAPGLRFDHHSQSGGFLAPRLVILYQPQNNFLLSFTGQRAHRVPNFEELFLSSSVKMNPNLNDEKSLNTDLGGSWTPSALFQIKSTGFFIRKTNIISPDANSTWANGGVEKTRGVETEVNWGIGNDEERRNNLIFHWTVQNSRRSLPTSPSYVDSALSPHQLLTVRWEKHFPRSITISNEIRHQSDQYEFDNRQGLKIPASSIWNARLSLKILSADLYFSIDNISRERYSEAIGQNPTPGGGTTSVLSPQNDRSFWTGISIRFTN